MVLVNAFFSDPFPLLEGSYLNNSIRSLIASQEGSPMVPGSHLFEKRGQVGSLPGLGRSKLLPLVEEN